MFGWFGQVSFVPFSKIMEFARHLKDGRLMGSACKRCGYATFPPRADCPECMSGDFEFREYSGKGTIFTYSTIAAAPTGFDDLAPYTVVVVDLEEGGRLLGMLGSSMDPREIDIGMPVQAVPRIAEDVPQIKVSYTIEKPGTSWSKAPAPFLGWSTTP
ncbi:MAG: Zn-ribbon domain-containing OB-fold protein [Deltaproteobacteria bacterium]|nr:Zn-ribbon domain-containing OB-fold protein [Deltaproteobacteria bacterium]